MVENLLMFKKIIHLICVISYMRADTDVPSVVWLLTLSEPTHASREQRIPAIMRSDMEIQPTNRIAVFSCMCVCATHGILPDLSLCFSHRMFGRKPALIDPSWYMRTVVFGSNDNRPWSPKAYTHCERW